MGATANEAIRWLNQSKADEATLAADPVLARMLDEFRSHGPVPYLCSAEGCRSSRIAYWALSDRDARAVFGPKTRTDRRRKGEYQNEPPPLGLAPRWYEPTSVRSAAIDLEYPGLPELLSFDPYLEWAMLPDSNVELGANPTVKSPYPLRFRFTCPACGAVYRLTNKSMLREFLRAIALGKRAIRPGRM